MSDEWSFRHARNHVSSAAVGQGPSMSSSAPTDQDDSMQAITRQCNCAACAGSTSNGPPTWYNSYHENWDTVTRPPGVSTDTYTDQGQGVNNSVGQSLTQVAPVLAQTQFAAPGPGVQYRNNPEPLQVAVGIPQPLAAVQPVQPRQDPTIGISVAEGLRRLADRYVNSPDSVVGVVRLQPGPSGGFQVLIILEVAGLL